MSSQGREQLGKNPAVWRWTQGCGEAIAPQAELEALIQDYSEQANSLSLTPPPSDAAGARPRDFWEQG